MLRRGPLQYLQLRDLGQPGHNFVLNTFAEISVFWITAQVIERQHRDRFWRRLSRPDPREIRSRFDAKVNDPGDEKKNSCYQEPDLGSSNRLALRGRADQLCRHGSVSKIISEQIRQRQFDSV